MAKKLIDPCPNRRYDKVYEEGLKMLNESSCSPALLPCPFCGSNPTVRRNNQFGYTDVFCPNEMCSVTRMSRAGSNDDNAIEAWNTREG